MGRFDVMTLTEVAAERVKSLVDSATEPAVGLRIGIKLSHQDLDMREGAVQLDVENARWKTTEFSASAVRKGAVSSG